MFPFHEKVIPIGMSIDYCSHMKVKILSIVLYRVEGREIAFPAPASSARIGANLGAVYAGMTVN